MATENNIKENPPKIFVERDVLNQENIPSGSTTKAHPNRIFIALAILIFLAIVYWFVKGY